MRKLTLFCLALCAMAFYSLPLKADGEVLIDSIYYKLDAATLTASVQRLEDNQYYLDNYIGYSTKVTIPAQVKHGGKTYTVTKIKYIYPSKDIQIEELKLPGTITSIEEYGLRKITGSLKRINIPAKIKFFMVVWVST